jgi:predicted nucleic acid-binding Zn ribbon protein
MSQSVEYRFECPECAESIDVNESMKDAIQAHGCVVCGTKALDGAFQAP